MFSQIVQVELKSSQNKIDNRFLKPELKIDSITNKTICPNKIIDCRIKILDVMNRL